MVRRDNYVDAEPAISDPRSVCIRMHVCVCLCPVVMKKEKPSISVFAPRRPFYPPASSHKHSIVGKPPAAPVLQSFVSKNSDRVYRLRWTTRDFVEG